jgi:hypothetical protein
MLLLPILANITIKNMTNIKIVYQTTPEENDIPWENHFSDIIDGIDEGKKTTFKVYIKNKMPIAEMDTVVKEICDALDFRFGTLSNYCRNDECIAAGYTDMLSSATYYIEIRINK